MKYIIEGKIEGGIEVRGRQRRRCKQLLDDLKETRGYCKLKEEAIRSNLYRTRLGRGYGHVVRHTTECTNVCLCVYTHTHIKHDNFKFQNVYNIFVNSTFIETISSLLTLNIN